MNDLAARQVRELSPMLESGYRDRAVQQSMFVGMSSATPLVSTRSRISSACARRSAGPSAAQPFASEP